MCREYNRAKESAGHAADSPRFPTLAQWVRDAVRMHRGAHPDMDNDVYLLSNPPRCTVRTYKRIGAYGNHFRVRDADTPSRVTYDCGLICVFNESTSDSTRGPMQMGYVGELTDIWLLDYGDTSTPIILLKGDWVQQVWSGARATMKRD